MAVATEFSGSLRPEIRVLEILENGEFFRIEVQWKSSAIEEAIWKETCKVASDRSFASQIVGEGKYQLKGKEFIGILRPEIGILNIIRESSLFDLEVKWREPETREVIWEENFKLPFEQMFTSLVVFQGEYRVNPDTHFVDRNGKRHFNIYCEVGKIGTVGLPIN